MSEQNRSPETGGRKRQLSGGIFYHNTFVLIFSFLVAVILWFVMMSQNTERNRTVYDVPIEVTLSGDASADGIRVFTQTYDGADLEVAGNSMITNKLTADDFVVTALLNPSSTKLTGNTMQKATIQVRVTKNSTLADYQIVSVNPSEITVEYDRYKEATFPIEQSLKYSADSGYVTGTPALTVEQVTVTGPESSVNKISRAVVDHTLNSPLRANAVFSCPVRFYDQNDQEMSDISGLYLETDVNTVEITIPVLSKKTVSLKAVTLHQPKGFAEGRISVEPAQIDIAGEPDVLSSISEITLDTPIDFADLDLIGKKSFSMDIPLPAGVRNLSATGENAVTQATVSINLNGYEKASYVVPYDNFQISNKPADRNVEFSTLYLSVTVIGSQAQINRLTGDSLSVQMDLANFAERIGTVEVPVTISVTGSGSDSCWVLGKYSVSATFSDSESSRTANLVNAPAESTSSDDTDTVAAAPQE